MDDDLEVIKDKGPRDGVTVMASEASHQFVHPISSLIQRYGRFYRMKKALSWWRMYLVYLKDKWVVKGPLTFPELVSAENLILRHVQDEDYHVDLIALKSVGRVKKSSSLRKLSPSLHDGLIVVGFRLAHAPLATPTKFPIVLPHGHKVVCALI